MLVQGTPEGWCKVEDTIPGERAALRYWAERGKKDRLEASFPRKATCVIHSVLEPSNTIVHQS